MVPIPTTYSSNQWTVIAETNDKLILSFNRTAATTNTSTTNDGDNHHPRCQPNEPTTSSTTVHELTKDIMNDEEEHYDDQAQSQEIDWKFGDGDEIENNDDGIKMDSKDNKSDDIDEKNETSQDLANNSSRSSCDDNDEEEVDISLAVSSAGRKKKAILSSKQPMNVSEVNNKEEERDEDNFIHNSDSTDDESEDDSSEDDEEDETDDDKTVAMSDDEDLQEGTANPQQPDNTNKESPSPIPTARTDDDNIEEDEDSDVWLDDSDNEGANWRLKEQKTNCTDTSEGERDGDDDEEENEELGVNDINDSEMTTANENDPQEEKEQENNDDPTSGETAASPPRRSSRPHKSRSSYSDSEDSSKSKRVNDAKKPKKPPKRQVWLDATDQLFVQTEDKETVTVKQILVALEKKFDCKMTKKLKSLTRERLKALIDGKVKPAGVESDDEGSTDREDADDEASVASDPEDLDPESSDFEAEMNIPKRKKKSTGRRGKSSKKKGDEQPKKLSKRKAARAAKIVEAQKLRRKQRMEELKVRNEEMQLNQTKEDQERAEAIAAKFETNTDELRLKRLEDRLDLLQRLDQKRISVVEIKQEVQIKLEETVAEVERKKEDSESEDSSSEEENLVIVGMNKPIKPLKPLHNQLPSRSLSLLDEIRSPKFKKNVDEPKPGFFSRTNNGKDGMITSPGTSMGARFALRNALKQKQRKLGNLWLARELGYKTEEDHLRDCKTAAEQKRELVLKLEQERLQANERKQLRERILLQEGGLDADPEDDASGENEDTSEVEEEDEEIRMAMAIEQETQENGFAGFDVEEEKPEEDDANDCSEPIGESFSVKETKGSDEPMPDSVDEEESQPLETQPPVGLCSGKSTDNYDEYDQDTLSGAGNEPPFSATLDGESQPPLEPQQLMLALEAQDSESFESHPVDTQESVACDGDGGMKSKVSTIDHKGSMETVTPDDSVVTPEREVSSEVDAGITDAVSGDEDDEDELEFVDDDKKGEEESPMDSNHPRNAGWQEMLKKEAERLKKLKKRKGGLVEEEAEEEEEEEVAGLEDFGFSISKKKKDDDEDEDAVDELDEDDLKHIVDDVSDGEGDEDAGLAARKKLEQREEKERHKEILRRMREGYDGRRGGIAGGSAGARGMHRFDQLVAADNREDAKRLGLLNDDELDSDEEKEEKNSNTNKDEEDDEAALLDKMLKHRFLHRSDVDLDERFSDDDEEEENNESLNENDNESGDEEERTQERLAKRFTKRARMQRLEGMYGDSQEFSQQRLIDEDTTIKDELKKMRNGLMRRRSTSSTMSHSLQSLSDNHTSGMVPPNKRQRTSETSVGHSFFQKSGGSLSIALQASRKSKRRTTFLGTKVSDGHAERCSVYKTVALSHVVYNSQTSASSSLTSGIGITHTGKRPFGSTTSSTTTSSSLFSRVAGKG